MTGFKLPDTLRQHRPLLLACEAIGWLHMNGKAKIDFLKGHGGQKNNYDYKNWHNQENPPFPWDKLLQWVEHKYHFTNSNNTVWPSTFSDFLGKHKGSGPGILGLLQAGHAMASGIEKNLPTATSEYLGQDITHMWLSTAFGYPVRNLLADPPELLGESGWRGLLERVRNLLTDLQQLGDNPNYIDGWWRWRNGAVGPEGWLRKAFTGTLAETRLPNNDVSLFDQSYVAAALFKSALAGAILENSSFPWSDKRLKQQTRWRLLTIGIGADHYEARAVKIGDWSGARFMLDEFFTKVCKLVEVDLALGSLLYRDGEICVFSFPGERFDHDKQGDILQIAKWKSYLTEQIDGYARDANLEMPPYCSIISEPSRSLVGMTGEIRKTRETMVVPLHRSWQIPEQDSADGHVCPVCLVRRSKKRILKRIEKLPSKEKPCDICKERRTGRLDSWIADNKNSDTIWISEVADANDRVALVTMSLDIEAWLDGTRLDLFRTQSVAKWAANNTPQNKTLPEDHDSLVDLINTALGKGNHASRARSLIKKKIAPGLKDENKNDVSWDKFYELMVEDRADAPKWNELAENDRAGWLTHQLFRKLASPGRIYRFERQAEDFFKELLAEFREIAAADQNRWRVRRLLLKTDDNSWKHKEPYAGRFNDKPFDLLYHNDHGGFISISNMSRLLEKTEGKESLKGKTIQLKDDDNNPVHQLTISKVEDAPSHLGVYHPVIPLNLSPVRFRVLLPLEATSTCVDRALEKWNKEFSCVWAQLPLRIGVVSFPRMTPFQAVIESARNIEGNLVGITKPETWRVAGCETRAGVTALSIKSLDQRQGLLQTIPIRLPDGREDVFYPYQEVEDRQTRFPLDFKHPDGRVFRHVKDLQNGDGVLVYPSLISTIFMDGTAKRFEPLSVRPLTEWQRMRELWSLIERSVPSQTALRGAWSEIVERREDWKGPDGTWLEGGKSTWLDFARAIFHERLGVRDACLETLIEAAGDEIISWSLEWHITVLKKHLAGGYQ